MDPSLFLGLPIDVRKQVYFFLNGRFIDLGADMADNSYFTDLIRLPTKRYQPNKYQRLLRDNLYSIFEPYLGIFDYSPTLIDKWLQYSLWLRYDCIVLDCMRVNHLYEGELIGPLNLIHLDGKIRMAFFDNNYMMWNWYTFKEYARWIDDPYDQTEMRYLKLNLEYLRYDLVIKILRGMEKDQLLDFISRIQFEQEEDNDQDDKLMEPDNQEDFESLSYRITDSSIIEVIRTMEFMKGLRSLIFRGDRLYESLVNFHGVRDNPGKTINYITKNRILFIKILQAGSLCKTGIADFTRWENLRELKLVRINEIDFNKMLLPPKCRLLTICGSHILYWWDIMDQIEQMMGDCYSVQICNNRQYHIMDSKTLDVETSLRCQITVSDSLRNLDFIKLQDIYEIKGLKIAIPRSLFYNKRILMDGEIGVEKIIIV